MDDRRWILALKIGVSVMLLARGWLTFHWDSPIRSLLWHEEWLAGPLETLTGYSWHDYARHSGPWLDRLFQVLGIVFMLSAALPWLRWARAAGWLWLPAVILVLDALGRWIGAGYTIGMAIEQSLQIAAPIVLWLSLRHPNRERLWLAIVLAAAALTFIGHGLYAAGIHPVPLSYQTMTMDILGIGQEPTLVLLKIAGWLDFFAALALLLRPLRFAALLHMVAWGGLTALARVAAHFDTELSLMGLDPWLAETLVRTPHWLLPLLACFLIRTRRSRCSAATPRDP